MADLPRKNPPPSTTLWPVSTWPWQNDGSVSRESMAEEFGDGFGAAVNLEFFVAAADVAAHGMDM